MKAKKITAVLLSALIALSCTGGIGASAETVSKRTSEKASGSTSAAAEDDERESFLSSQLEFSVDLFKKSFAESKGENMLVSPLSAVPVLTMAANGADKDTLKEMEKALGGELSIAELNDRLSEYLSGLYSGEKCRLHIADSVWIKNIKGLSIRFDFLKTNRKYYNAQVFKEPFDTTTVGKINNWVKKNTDGMIEKMIGDIDQDTVMYLINALAFDAEWNAPYSVNDIFRETFTASDGSVQNAEMMRSEEKFYLSDSMATGFMKPYKDGKYSFAAILPNKNVTVEEYVDSLTAEGLLKMLTERKSGAIDTKTPKFKYDYDLRLDGVLKEMGIVSAFDAEKADFSKMANVENGNLYIGSVIQKTFIAVDENGTKAGAATAVEMKNDTIALPPIKKQVYLDRPFIYMIVDNETNLPIFMGCVEEVSESGFGGGLKIDKSLLQ
ncbi:MAG: serpin family protein [Bacteroides sp.]|nr:serpin family protein [Bacteroides sp.]